MDCLRNTIAKVEDEEDEDEEGSVIARMENGTR